MYKDYSVTVRDSVKQISDLDPKKKPLLHQYLKYKRNTSVCRGLDFGTFLTSPIKRTLLPSLSFSHLSRDSSLFAIAQRVTETHKESEPP